MSESMYGDIWQVLQCPEWVRLLYRKKEQVTRKSQVCDLKIRTLDDVDENGYLSGVPFLDVTQLKTTGSKAQRLGRGG